MMKKMFFVGLMLTAAMAASAQLKVAPKMAMGDQKTYVTTTTMNIPQQGEVNVTDESTYTVSEVLADGFVVKIESTKVTTDATADNIAGQLFGATQEMLMGVEVKVQTDKDGKPVAIKDYAELKKKIDARVEVLVDKLVKTVPALAQLPKETIKAQISDGATEEALLGALTNTANPLALNGKTIMTGATEEYVADQGIKMKRMYFVNGQKVTVNSSMNMTKEDMKQMLIKTVEKMAPDQADMVKQNIDAVMESGMLKIDAKATSSFELQSDGWVKRARPPTT